MKTCLLTRPVAHNYFTSNVGLCLWCAEMAEGCNCLYFHPFKVVYSYRDPQHQVGENINESIRLLPFDLLFIDVFLTSEHISC